MQSARLDGFELEYDEVGSGEPLLLIHGGLIGADSFVPLLAEPSIGGRYRGIVYNRRGYGGSSSPPAPFTIAQQAADARALLGHLGIPRAHVAGHSYGGAIAMQLSLDAPERVGSLALLEPAGFAGGAPPPEFQEAVASAVSRFQRGDRAGAVHRFLASVLDPEYRQVLEKFLPPGAFERAVADAETGFRVELGALQAWRFGAAEAAHIAQPVLAVVGEKSAAMFEERHQEIRRWIPHAEELRIPQTHHALQYMNPRAVAGGLARFLERHPL